MNVLPLSQLAVGDPDATRTVYAAVVGLGVVGVLLVGIAFWLIRQTRPERELLGPLEHMGDRRWRSLDTADRRRALDEVRPSGANPVSREPGVPEIDAEFAQSTPSLANFDDLQTAKRDDESLVASTSASSDESGEPGDSGDSQPSDDDAEFNDPGESDDPAELDESDDPEDDDTLTESDEPGDSADEPDDSDDEPDDSDDEPGDSDDERVGPVESDESDDE